MRLPIQTHELLQHSTQRPAGTLREAVAAGFRNALLVAAGLLALAALAGEPVEDVVFAVELRLGDTTAPAARG